MLDIGIKIASALDMALKHDLLHRDIKPGNILFNADHEPKLVDFGLAQKTDAEQESDDVTWGTPYYVAPEKIKREPETFLSDMYSLGATLYHALIGRVPFDAPTAEEVIVAQVQTPLTPPNLAVPEITQPTSDALTRALAKNPARPLFKLRRISAWRSKRRAVSCSSNNIKGCRKKPRALPVGGSDKKKRALPPA